MSRALVRVLSYVYQAKVNVRIRKHRISKRVNEIIKQLKKAAICLNTNADREREREKTLTYKTHIIIIHGNCGILIEKISSEPHISGSFVRLLLFRSNSFYSWFLNFIKSNKTFFLPTFRAIYSLFEGQLKITIQFANISLHYSYVL